MRFPCKQLDLQGYSIILNDNKQEKNDTKINYFMQLRKLTFYEKINFDGFVKSRHSGENRSPGRL